MIRRDYILRMIAEFVEMLNRLQGLKQGQLWREANETVEEQCHKLLGSGLGEVMALSETELLARIIQGEPTQAVRDKVLLLTTLLKETGDIAAGQNRSADSRSFYLKALHLLLYTLAQGDPSDWPEFVPRVDRLLTLLSDAPLPLATQAGLMQHFERNGEFARAEDALFSMLEADPAHPGLAEFGVAFYERLRRHPDTKLAEGGLPRSELETGLAELRQRFATAS